MTEADAARIEALMAENEKLKVRAQRSLEGLWAVLMTFHPEGEAHVTTEMLELADRGHVQCWSCVDGTIMFKALEADKADA
ncbi:MAG TPA: hypothetical protein VGJ79_00610 [Candidatus Dormibacteraeota bacterium]